jgi:hypothetical protein
MDPTQTPARQIRAVFTDTTIRVYQAYNNAIADSALSHQTFVSPPFSLSRMTWIKPSFLWMMYRAGWGFKDKNQRRILAIDITHEGFQWALAHSCPSHPPAGMSADEWETLKQNSPARIQWDPERDLHHNPLPHRSIQIGIAGEAARLYTRHWIQKITEVTSTAHAICALVKEDKLVEAAALCPAELPYAV